MFTITVKKLPTEQFHIVIRVDSRIVVERTTANRRAYQVAEYIAILLKNTPETQEIIK